MTTQPPNNSHPNIESDLSECNEAEKTQLLRDLSKQLLDMGREFPIQILPSKSRQNIALLGAFSVHHSIYEYSSDRNLREIVEETVNSRNAEKIILSVCSKEKIECAHIGYFSYDHLFALHKSTHANDFILTIGGIDEFYIFHIDDPACIISLSSGGDFSLADLDASSLNRIFSRRMLHWRINSLPSQAKWLESVRYHLDLV